MSAPDGIDLGASNAVLIGTARYTRGLPSIPPARGSVDAMFELLTGPYCGWPAERVHRFDDPTTGDALLTKISRLVHETSDVLVFYYVGHGQLINGGEDLGLALADTDTDARLRRSTSLRFSDLRQELDDCASRVKLVMLDCCYSGVATQNTLGMDDLVARVDRATAIKGAFTLTASRRNEEAFFPAGGGGLTYFTGFLTEIVREGVPGGHAALTLLDIYDGLERRFRDLNDPDVPAPPKPTKLITGDADRFEFARNAAFVRSQLASRHRPRPPQLEAGSSAPPSGPDTSRVAEVEAQFSDESKRSASGYRVYANRVLTALSVVEGATLIRLRFPGHEPDGRTIEGRVVWRSLAARAAVIEMADKPAAADVDPGRAVFGRLPDYDGPVLCSVLGFKPGDGHGQIHHEVGTFNPLVVTPDGSLKIKVHAPRQAPGGSSAWSSMAGATVWSDGRLIGIVGEQSASESSDFVRASRIDQWFENVGLEREELAALDDLIGLDYDRLSAGEVRIPEHAVIPAVVFERAGRGRDVPDLPRDPADFVGRATEVSKLIELLRPDNDAEETIVVSAVAGLGGIGKTALAVHTAHRMLERGWFAGGAVFLDLHGFDPSGASQVSADQAVVMLLQALGVRDEQIPARPEERLRLYRSVMAALLRHRLPVLIVLDNVYAEHQAAEILPERGAHRMLITSRKTLGALSAVRLIDLDVLEGPAARSLINRALTAARADDHRAASEPGQVDQLIDLCGRLPLALQIVAARLKTTPNRSVLSLVQEIESDATRLDALTYHGDPTVAVKSAFDLSYRYLEPDVAWFFRVLSISPGPDIDVAAAAALTGWSATATRGRLESLERVHLLTADTSGERWSMHNLVRLYASDHVRQDPDKGSYADSRTRVLEYYAAALESSSVHQPATNGVTPDSETRSWLAVHRGHLLSSTAMALEAGRPDLVLRLSEGLTAFLREHRYRDDWVALALATKDAAQLIGDRELESRAWAGVGEALEGCDRLDDAAEAYRKALAISRNCGNHLDEIRGLMRLGQVLRAQGAVGRAIAEMRRAIRIADRHAFEVERATSRSALMVVLADLGRAEDALRVGQRAEEILLGVPEAELALARLRVNLGLVLQRTGHIAEALAAYADAENTLREQGDARYEAMMLNLRGVARAYAGEHASAELDFDRAASLAREHGFDTLRRSSLHNLGFSALRSGDLTRALRQFDEALSANAASGSGHGAILLDRAEALLAAGLAREALESAEQALDIHEQAGYLFNAAEARLLVARAALAAEDTQTAADQARVAREAFTGQRRPEWACWARSVEHAARFASGERSVRLLRELIDNTLRLEKAGWLVSPQESRLLAARTALDLGRQATAEGLLQQATSARHSGPVQTRILAWEAEAALCETRGDIPGASRAVTNGLAIVAESAAALGATERRVNASSLGTDLATTGLRLALSGGSARQLLVRSEQWRAMNLRRRPVRPPRSETFAERLRQLRTVTAQISEEGLAGRSVRSLQLERVKLEREVRELSWHSPGGPYAPEPTLDLRHLSERLGEFALVEYVRLGDSLHAVTFVDGRARRYDLSTYTRVLSELESLRFSLSRIARRFGSPALHQAAIATYEYACDSLDELLIQPLVKHIKDRPLVLVPTGSLHVMAWPMLPSLVGRRLIVAPSARSWLTAAERTPLPSGRAGHVVLAHGPGIPQAEAEIGDLSAHYPHPTVLAGADATVEAVLDALDGASVAHISAHGRFRSDNPLFSSLELADGPLTAYDLEALARGPELMVLAACDSALSGIRPGDELMGTASALFAVGTRTLIAAVADIGDSDTRSVMATFHSLLRRGASPAEALQVTQQHIPEARAFLCLGAGL